MFASFLQVGWFITKVASVRTTRTSKPCAWCGISHTSSILHSLLLTVHLRRAPEVRCPLFFKIRGSFTIVIATLETCMKDGVATEIEMVTFKPSRLRPSLQSSRQRYPH